MFNEVIFDVETKTWFDEIDEREPGKLGISIVSAYTRKLDDNLDEIEGKLISFWEDELIGLWPLFQEADRVIGFNSISFDVPVLTPYANFPLNKLPHFDIMLSLKDVLGHRISLNAIAKETLAREKLEEGAMATELWKLGDKKSLRRLREYCEEDVRITKDIYDYGLKKKLIKYKDKWNTLRSVDVDFGYPSEYKKQIGLF
jgi:DEAD/DEAH box helicase domain-containing protein